MPNIPSDFPEFEPLSPEDMEFLSDSFFSVIKGIVKKLEIDKEKLSVSKPVIYDIIERVEKRRVYFHIFHKKIKMGEINECSLYCFWILKLCPFHYKDAEKGEINQVLAFYIFVSVLKFLAKTRNKKFNLAEEKYHSLYYAFRYRDLSKEAIMAIAQSLIY